jgi:hypothetical protein
MRISNAQNERLESIAFQPIKTFHNILCWVNSQINSTNAYNYRCSARPDENLDKGLASHGDTVARQGQE